MKIDEIVRRLEPWKKRHDALMMQYDALRKLTGAMPDSEMMRPVFDTWNAYTVAISEIVGDKDEWLQWYQLECDMGRKPKEVKSDTCAKFRVRTLRQLARAISW